MEKVGKTIPIRVALDRYKELQAIAAKEDRSVSYLIRQAIAEFLDRRKKQ